MKVSVGGAFAAILVLLALLLVVDIGFVEGGQLNVHSYASAVEDGRVIRVSTVPAHEGDLVQVRPQWDIPGDSFSTHDLWVVAGGTGMASAIAGGPPADAHATRLGMSVQDSAAGHLQVRHPGGTPGLDVVRVYHFAPGVSAPEGEARGLFEELVLLETASAPSILILREGSIAVHRVTSVAMPMLSVAAVGVLAWWIWTLRLESFAVDPETPTASLVAVVALGGRYLTRMRGLAFALLLPVAMLGWLLGAFVFNQASELVAPAPTWTDGLAFASAVLVGTLALALLAVGVMVHVRRKEWQEAFDSSPWLE